MTIHQLSVEEALQSLHSKPTGLSGAEAERRSREFGPNRVERLRGTPWPVRFLRGFCHFFALILWVAAALSFLAEWQDPGTGMATLGFAILGVILVNGLFSFWQEYRAEQAMAALQKLLPHQVKVLRDGKMRQSPAEELVPGDVVLLDDGDDIPADCRLIEAFGVRVNNATVTGESVPQARDERSGEEEELLHSRNILLAGTSLVSGQAKALVFATGMHTEFGKIAHLTQGTREVLSPLQKEIVRLSRLVAILSVGLGAIFFFIGQVLGLSFWHNFLFAIGIIVANVPEGLLPTVTLALAMGSQRMAKKNALIRHLPSVETLGSATVICTDKTGTLTKNRMEVKKLFLSKQFHDAAGGDRLTGLKAAHRPFFEAAFLCHTLKELEQEGRRTVLGDPLEIALVRMAEESLPPPVSYPRVDEVPFDSDRGRLSTLHRTPQGLVLIPPPGSNDEMVARQRTWDQLSRLQAPGGGIEIDQRMSDGDPAAEILRVARDNGCDMIVMGTLGRTGLRRLLLGSVAEQVVREASCPVLTVRTSRADSTPASESQADEKARPA